MRPANVFFDPPAVPKAESWPGLAPLGSDRAPVALVSNAPLVKTGTIDETAALPDPTAGRDKIAFDPRRMTPREMAGRSIELYAAGHLRWEDQDALAFQPELHPDYDRTIGALLGQNAAPDVPRDFIVEWERRLLFELRYNAENTEAVGQARRILKALRKMDGTATDLSV